MRQLPYIDFSLAAGVNSNFVPASQAGQTLRSAVNVDGYRVFRALNKVPGASKITAAALGGSVRSIHQFEYSDLTGTRTRKQLAAANTTLFDITGGGATVVWTTPDLFDEPLRSVSVGNRIYFSSERQRALPTGGIKYDGRSIAYSTTNLGSRWGVLAPGTEPTVRHALDDHTLWTATGTASKANSTTSRDGAGSVQVDSSGAGTAGIEDAGLALNFGTSVRAFVWVYIPAGGLQKLATSGVAVEVEIGDAGLGNSDHYTFGIGALITGWNLLSLNLTDPDSEDGTGANLAAVDTIRLSFVTTAALSGVLWDNFYTVDNGQVSAAATGTDGELLGAFSYRATFLSEFGLESNAGPIAVETPSFATGSIEFHQPGGAVGPRDGHTITIGSRVYTLRDTLSSPAVADEILKGSFVDTAANLAAALNGDAGAGTIYSTGTTAHADVTGTSAGDTTTVTSREQTAVANTIVTISSQPDSLTWAADYLTGGSDGFASVSAAASYATGELTLTGVVLNNETVTIGGIEYTFKTVLTGAAYEVLIGGAPSQSRTNLIGAINDFSGSAAEGTEWGTGTLAHPLVRAYPTVSTSVITIVAKQIGTAANAIATTETFSAGANVWAAGTMSGGRDGEQVNLSTIPVSSDPQVIARRVYRDLDGDRVYRFVTQIDNNIDTTYTDNVADASLGEATMPIAGDDQIDHSPPERMRDVAFFNNRVFGISGDDPTILLISDVDLPEAFPIVNQLGIDDEMVALKPHTNGLLIYGRTRTYILGGDGTDANPFTVELFNSALGANNPACVIDPLGFNVALKNWELYLVDNLAGGGDVSRNSWLLNGPVLDAFAAESAANLSAAFMVHDRARYRVISFVGSSIYAYQYGTLGFQEITGSGPGTTPKDLRVAAWWNLTYPVSVTAAADVEESADRPEVWIGGSDGHVYQLQDETRTAYANGAADSAIAASFETHAYPLGPVPDRGKVGDGDAQAGRGEPRYLEVNSESTSGIVWAATVTVLSEADGTVLGSTSFNVTCPAGTSVVTVPVPTIGVLGSWVRVSMSNSSTTTDGIIRHLRLYYIGRVSRRGPRAT